MNLNTIAEVKRPTSADRDHAMARRIRMACRRHLALLGAADLHRHAHRPSSSCTGRRCSPRRRSRHRGDVHALRSFTGSPAPLSGSAPAACARVLQLASWRRSRSGTRPRSAATSACRCRPGPMISLTVALEATYTLVAARRARARGSLHRFRDRKSRQHSPAGRAAPQHPLAGIGAVEALRVPPRLAHASRALGGAADRHRKRGRRRSPDHDHGGDPRPVQLRFDARAIRNRSCGARSTSASRPTDISTTSTARPPTSATSPAISPSRSAPSWRNPERAHETCRTLRMRIPPALPTPG